MSRVNRTPVVITTRDAGVAFGTVGEVRSGRRRRVVHTTAPRPFGMRAAAADDAQQWAYDHGYLDVQMPDTYGDR